MLTIQQLKLPVSHTEGELEKKILKTLKIKKEELLSWTQTISGCQEKAGTFFCIYD